MAEHRLNNADYVTALEEGSRPPGLSLADIVSAFLEAEFLVPLEDLPTTGDGRVSPRLFQSGGDVALLAFTDREAARTLLPDDSVPAVAVPGTVLCQMAAQMLTAGAPLGGLVVNPSGPIPFALSADQIREIVEGHPASDDSQSATGQLNPDSVLYVGLPTPPWGEPLPMPLWEALRNAVAGAGVQEAYWLLLVQTEGRRDIMVAVAGGDTVRREALAAELQDVWNRLGTSDCSVVLTELTGDWATVMRERGERLYHAL